MKLDKEERHLILQTTRRALVQLLSTMVVSSKKSIINMINGIKKSLISLVINSRQLWEPSMRRSKVLEESLSNYQLMLQMMSPFLSQRFKRLKEMFKDGSYLLKDKKEGRNFFIHKGISSLMIGSGLILLNLSGINHSSKFSPRKSP
jgi:hypothetical protein